MVYIHIFFFFLRNSNNSGTTNTNANTGTKNTPGTSRQLGRSRARIMRTSAHVRGGSASGTQNSSK